MFAFYLLMVLTIITYRNYATTYLGAASHRLELAIYPTVAGAPQLCTHLTVGSTLFFGLIGSVMLRLLHANGVYQLLVISIGLALFFIVCEIAGLPARFGGNDRLMRRLWLEKPYC